MRLLNRSNIGKLSIGLAMPALCLALTSGSLTAAPLPSVPPDNEVPAPMRIGAPLDVQGQAVALDRAGRIRDMLGFPIGVTRTAKHVKDGFVTAEYDEVDELRADGHMASITQLDADGRLRSAVRFDKPGRGGRKVNRDEAVQSARRSAQAVGLTLDGIASVDADGASDGWSVHWDRVVQGFRVRGDETRVQLWPNGQIWSVSRVEHSLADAPSQAIGQAQARLVATDNLSRWFAGRGWSFDIQPLDLEWVEPNDAFGQTVPVDSSGSAPYRLAWVAQVKPSGGATSYLLMMCVYVDAGNGRVIGGDFVE